MDVMEQKQEVSQMIAELISGQLSEADGDKLFEEISRLSPDPEWSKYVFQSSDYYAENDLLDIDAVVEKIFNYKPIQL